MYTCLYDSVTISKAIKNNKIANKIQDLSKGESVFLSRKKLIAHFGNTYYSIINGAYYSTHQIKNTPNGNLIISRNEDKEDKLNINHSVRQYIHNHSIGKITDEYPVDLYPNRAIINGVYLCSAGDIMLYLNSSFVRITDVKRYRNKRRIYVTDLSLYVITNTPTENLFFDNIDQSRLYDDSYIIEIVNNQTPREFIFWQINSAGCLVAV